MPLKASDLIVKPSRSFAGPCYFEQTDGSWLRAEIVDYQIESNAPYSYTYDSANYLVPSSLQIRVTVRVLDAITAPVNKPDELSNDAEPDTSASATEPNAPNVKPDRPELQRFEELEAYDEESK